MVGARVAGAHQSTCYRFYLKPRFPFLDDIFTLFFVLDYWLMYTSDHSLRRPVQNYSCSFVVFSCCSFVMFN